MMRIRESEYGDPEQDLCGCHTVAVLEYGGIRIALCEDCLKSIKEDLETIDFEIG